ncbi:MAG: hypothetical protein HY395_00770 [Candidatus Doudnabacteria bacterium]|nr:hypothetical protein [Candidatus Doudnabacteria bacterium]
MNSRYRKRYLFGTLVIAVILGSFTFVKNSSALENPPPRPSGPPVEIKTSYTKINDAMLAKAQTSLAECQKFKDELWQASNGIWKAYWYLGDLSIGIDPGCYVVPRDWDDPLNNGTSEVPPNNRYTGAIELENLIKNTSYGVPANFFTSLQAVDEADKKEASGVSKVVGLVLGFIVDLLNRMIAGLTAIAGRILTYVLELIIVKAEMPQIVTAGWKIVRDIMNMFFVLIMIVISLATILGLENYNYKKLLTKLILMALLINFSQIIAVTLIDLSNMVVKVFALEGNYADVYKTMIGITTPEGWLGDSYGIGWSQNFVQGLTSLILNVIMLISFLALAGLFVVRLVGLYVLVIFSPVAYALNIIPETAQYAKQWWTTFVKYLIWAPVAMFMVWLVIFITKPQGVQQDIIDKAGGGDSYFKFVILTAFMFAAVYVAKQAGMVGSEAIISLADKAMKGTVAAPFKWGAKGAWAGTKALAGYGAEELLRRKNWEIRPRKWIEGWKESREENRRAREEAGLAKAEGKSVFANPTSFFQRYWSWKGIGKAVTGANKRGQKMLNDAADLDAKANEIEQQASLKRAPYEKAAERWQAELDREKAFGGDEGDIKRLEGLVARANAQADEAAAPLAAEATQLRKLANEKAEEAKQLVHDPDYFTQRKLREATNHERAKVLGETWQEMFDIAEGAVEEKHIARFKAVFEKLADTYNENELITHWKYNRDMNAQEAGAWKDVKSREMLIARALKPGFKDADGRTVSEADAKRGNFKMHKKGDLFQEDKNGIENFRKLVLQEKMGMSEAASMRHLADIGDIAAKRGHVGIWRLYNTKNGRWQMNSFDDWDTEMRIEKGKMHGDFATTNRLFGHDEYTGTAKDGNQYRIAITQKNELEETISQIDDVNMRLGRGTFNFSKARALAFDPNIVRLRNMAGKLDDKNVVKAQGIGNQPLTGKVEFKDERGNRRAVTVDRDGKVTDDRGTEMKWTRKHQALYTLSQLERIGLEQFKQEELKGHREALEQLLDDNEIEERHRESIRAAGMNKFGSVEI